MRKVADCVTVFVYERMRAACICPVVGRNPVCVFRAKEYTVYTKTGGGSLWFHAGFMPLQARDC
jgi:hypothetical protein